MVVAFATLLAVATHALWRWGRAIRLDLAVRRAAGCTRRRLDALTAWQALPAVVAALAIGVPAGIDLGRWNVTVFARSLAVVELARTTPVPVGRARRRTSSSIDIRDW